MGFVGFNAGLAQALREVPSGPNAGLHYLVGLPHGVEARVHVHTVALAVGRALWQAQANAQWTTAAGDVMRAKKDVVPFAAVVRRHEGIGLDSRSHARFFRDSLFQIAGPATEAVVAGAAHEVVGKAIAVATASIAAARVASAKADSIANRPTYCYFSGIIY